MTQTTIKIVAIFGGGTVLFYTLGFTVVRTYMHKIRLEGMFPAKRLASELKGWTAS